MGHVKGSPAYRRASRHAERSMRMPCGREVYGNGGQSAHQNRCRTCLEKVGAYMPQSVHEGIFLNMESATSDERQAAYAQWKREEGDRLLAALPRLTRPID